MMQFGISAADFRSRYFEKEAYLRRGALADRPIGWPELDELLYCIEPTPTGMQLFHRGLLPIESFTRESLEAGRRRRRLDKIRFYAHMRGGATLVINRIDSECSSARALCTEVARLAGQPTTSNAYLSFGGDGTFGRHWDTHDVFAIQLIGRKQWRVFEPTLPLPLSQQTSERSDRPCPAQPVLTCTLEAGDVLYVPRGWWHEATPLDEGSLHLSVGAYAATARDYVSWLCSRVLPFVHDGRRALAASTPDQLASLLQHLRLAVLDPQLQSEFEQTLAAGESPASAFNLDLFLNQQVPTLDGATRLRLNTRVLPDAQGRLPAHGSLLQLDPVSVAVVRMLANSGPLEFSALVRLLGDTPMEAVHRAALDLIGRDVLSIEEADEVAGERVSSARIRHVHTATERSSRSAWRSS